jgi:hypothetical protein
MSNCSAKRGLGGGLGINMDKLVIVRGIRKRVNAVLLNPEPVGDADFLIQIIFRVFF